MRLLLDTHILLWGLTADSRLSAEASKLWKDPRNEILVSAASLWEIAVKFSLGRLTLGPDEISEAVDKLGFAKLPISFEHCGRLTALPSIHNDPFDRMLIAQSLHEPAILVTHDKLLTGYGANILLV